MLSVRLGTESHGDRCLVSYFCSLAGPNDGDSSVACSSWQWPTHTYCVWASHKHQAPEEGPGASRVVTHLCVYFPLRERWLSVDFLESSAELCVSLPHFVLGMQTGAKDYKSADFLLKIYAKCRNRIIPTPNENIAWVWFHFFTGAGFMQILFVYVCHLQEAKVLEHMQIDYLSANSLLPQCLNLCNLCFGVFLQNLSKPSYPRC